MFVYSNIIKNEEGKKNERKRMEIRKVRSVKEKGRKVSDVKWTLDRLKMLSTKCVYKSYIFDIYI